MRDMAANTARSGVDLDDRQLESAVGIGPRIGGIVALGLEQIENHLWSSRFSNQRPIR
jgi:hypothetical protein